MIKTANHPTFDHSIRTKMVVKLQKLLFPYAYLMSTWICTASSGLTWTYFMNARGSYSPIGMAARLKGP